MKRCLSAITAFIVCSNLFLPAFSQTTAPSFKDTANHWSKTYVQRLFQEGYVKGSNGYFYPNQALKTEDFLIMVVKVLDPSAKTLSADVGVPYYSPYLLRASALGLIHSEMDEVPQYVLRSMPRELAVQVVDRVLRLKGESITADLGLSYKFKDFEIINDINKEAVLRTYQAGMIKGSNGNFEPKNYLTRAEAAVLISKLLDKSLRDQLTIFKNPNTYSDVAQWYIDAYEKTVPKRTVVIEKKAGGLINTGDVDFTEKAFYYNGNWHNWWTDQEFEDRILGGINDRKRGEYTASMFGDVVGDLDYTSGYYFAHNGELAYILDDDKRDGKAYRHYDDYPSNSNMNRMMYDLSKYGAQFALLSGTYHLTGHFRDVIDFVMAGNSNVNGSGELGLEFYDDPVFMGKFLEYDFPVAFRMDVNNNYITKYKPLLNQVFIRIYGTTDGPVVFSKVQSMLKGRTGGSDWDISATVNGIHIRASARKYSDIVLSFSMK